MVNGQWSMVNGQWSRARTRAGRGPDADRTRAGRGPDAGRMQAGRGPDAGQWDVGYEVSKKAGRLTMRRQVGRRPDD